MTNSIEQKITQIKEIVRDWPADASTYVLLRSLQEILIPTKDKAFETTDPQNQMVGKQILLIINIANSIIEFLDVKKATFK